MGKYSRYAFRSVPWINKNAMFMYLRSSLCVHCACFGVRREETNKKAAACETTKANWEEAINTQ